MSFLACLRLFTRRFSLFFIVIFGGYGWFLYELFITEGERGFVAIAVIFPHVIGMGVAWTLGETMHRPFTWTLPGWRGRLGAWALIIGIAAASLSTAAVSWLGPPQSVFPLMLLFYFLGLYKGNSLAAPSRRFIILIMPVSLGLPLLLMIFGDELLAFCVHHPVLILAAMVIVCPAVLYYILNLRSARKRLCAPVYARSQEGQRRRRMLWARDVGDSWNVEFLGDGIVNWLRAGRYERSGWVGNGRGSSLFGSLVVVLAVLLIGSLAGLESGNGTLVQFAVTLTGSLPMETEETALLLILVSFMVCVGFFACSIPLFSLRKGAPYPLSRLQLARLTYAGSLFQALRFTLMLGACFVAAGALVGLFSGEGYSLEDSIGILGLIAWGPVYVPLMQWVHHTMLDPKGNPKSAWLLAVYCLFALLPWALAGVYHQYLLAAIGPWTFAVLGALFAALQAAFYFGLRRYYARADLI